MTNVQTTTALSLTHVIFNPDDPLSYLLAYVTLSPLAILVAYVTTIIARREVVAINMFIGQLTCELANAILKRVIREQRPIDKLGDGYGMPSSHAQFVGYFAVFAILHLYTRITFDNHNWKHPISVGILLGTILVSFSRIYLNYHTPTQVIVGYVIGSIFASCWFVLVEHVLRPIGAYQKLIDSPVAKYFYIKDSTNVPNVLKVEYAHWKNVEMDKVKVK